MTAISFAVIVVYCVTLGALLAFAFTLILKGIMSNFVSALIKEGANDEESAKTFDELSIKRTFLLSLVLKSNSTAKKIIKITDGDAYFLPKEYVEKATRFYVKEKLTLPTLILTIALIALVIALCEYIPALL